MRTILLVSTLLTFVSCSKTGNSDACELIQYDTAFAMTVGSTACLPDGRTIELITARDSFCPCFAICVWEGQLEIILKTTDLNGTEKEVFVGSTKNTPHGNAFEDVAISDFTYLYNGTSDSLPLCLGTFDENEITIILTLTL